MHGEFAREEGAVETADDSGSAGVSEATAAPTDGPPTAEAVFESLKSVFDPELGINVVDLGLIYDVRISEGGDVDIEYTLTTMGCPIGPLIEDQIRSFVRNLPGVGEIRPEMVLRPAWTPEMMSDEAKAALGIF